MDALDEAATAEALRQLPGWERAGDAVARTFVHDSFRLAVLFVERITASTAARPVGSSIPSADLLT